MHPAAGQVWCVTAFSESHSPQQATSSRLAVNLQEGLYSRLNPGGHSNDVPGGDLPHQAADDMHAEPSPLRCEMIFDAGWKSYSSLLYAAAADTYSLPAMMSLSQLLTMYMSVAVNPNVRKRKLNLHAQAARQCKCLPTAPGQDWANNCLAHPAPWAHFRHPPANGPRPPVSPCHGANAQSGCL